MNITEEAKMKRLKISPILIIISFFLSCHFPTNSTKESVTLSLTSDSMKIQIETLKKIYVFIVETDLAALIDWAPSFSHPSIDKGKTMEVKFSNIANGKSDPVKKGDRIIVYWWTDSYKTNNKLNQESFIL